ncbi:transcription initiation factor IIB [Haloarcula hispanica]|uniref:transcription initiation factor IIB n=1 Tax=Haloarcula hispanica TaxID=51589 RepID=UPI0011B38D8F|nr:hypothetical protein [Haloarcula hispanica]
MTDSNTHSRRMDDNSATNFDDQILHSRIKTAERGSETLPVAKAEINRLCAELSLDDSIETVAQAIYRRSLQTDVIQNRTIAEVAAATVYASCRIERRAISLTEVASAAATGKKHASRVYSEISRELSLNTGPTDPKDFVPRLCDELDLSKKTEEKAIEILEETMDQGLHSGKSPSAFAAASVYATALLCNEARTQTEVATVAMVSENTIRTRYQEQIHAMGITEDE